MKSHPGIANVSQGFPDPFVRNNSNNADYNTTTNSWFEQRTFVTNAPSLVAEKYPSFAKNLSEALADLESVVEPTSTKLQQTGYTEQPVMANTFRCGHFNVSFNEDGSVGTLRNVATGVDLVSDLM